MQPIPPKRPFKKAQSLIQYIVITTLVMASIIITGPYVIRSWNAHLKTLDDSIQDSFADPLLIAPTDDIDIPGCDCTWGDVVCDGQSTIPGWTHINCSPQEMLEEVNCIPAGCEDTYPINPKAQCVTESCCCELILGAVPDNCGSAYNPSVSMVHCSNSYIQPPCPVGTVESVLRCGGGTPTTDTVVCVPNTNCGGQCAPPLPPQMGDWCPNDTSGVPLSPNPYPVTPVISGGCTSTKCEFECNPWLVPNNGQCSCPPGYQNIDNECFLLPIYVKNVPGGSGVCNAVNIISCVEGYHAVGGGLGWHHNAPVYCYPQGQVAVHTMPGQESNQWNLYANSMNPYGGVVCLNNTVTIEDIQIVSQNTYPWVDAVGEVQCPAGYYAISGGMINKECNLWGHWFGPPIPPYCFTDNGPGYDILYFDWGISVPTLTATQTPKGWKCGGDDFYSTCYAVCAKLSWDNGPLTQAPPPQTLFVYRKSATATAYGSAVEVYCDPGDRRISGGIEANYPGGADNNFVVFNTKPIDNDGWRCQANNRKAKCYVLCEDTVP